VNTTLIHPDLPYIVTAGIEKDVILHSPKPSSPCFNDMQRSPTEVRTLGSDAAADRAAYIRALTEFDMVGGDQEDPEIMTIMMFDQ
jgi:WD repeat-containing protein 22